MIAFKGSFRTVSNTLLLLWDFFWGGRGGGEGGVVMFFLKKIFFFFFLFSFFGWKICNVSVMFLLLYVHVCVTRTCWKTRPRPKTVILPIKKSKKSTLKWPGRSRV